MSTTVKTEDRVNAAKSSRQVVTEREGLEEGRHANSPWGTVMQTQGVLKGSQNCEVGTNFGSVACLLGGLIADHVRRGVKICYCNNAAISERCLSSASSQVSRMCGFCMHYGLPRCMHLISIMQNMDSASM